LYIKNEEINQLKEKLSLLDQQYKTAVDNIAHFKDELTQLRAANVTKFTFEDDFEDKYIIIKQK
jgi:hypothetical protein